VLQLFIDCMVACDSVRMEEFDRPSECVVTMKLVRSIKRL
jgi:hypothetical protein